MKQTCELYVKTWTTGLSPDEKKELSLQLEQAEEAFLKLASILDQKIEGSVKRQRSRAGYESPNWMFEQADAIGYQRALSDVLTLIKPIKGDE